MTFHNERRNRAGWQVYVLRHHVAINRREFEGQPATEYIRLVEGDVEIEIEVAALINLANRAALSKSKKAQVGPLVARFKGLDQRVEVPKKI